MKDKITLDMVDKELFQRVWSIYSEMGVEERHFNSLQSTYRALTSTWLLATFGSIGYFLSDKMVNCPIDKWIMIIVIGFMSSTGIMLIWNLDLKVYHPLLAAAFGQGRLLEKQYSWLPQMRTNMMERMRQRGVVSRVIWFYIFGSSIPLMISGVAFVIWSMPKSIITSITGGGIFIVLIYLVCKFLYDNKRIDYYQNKTIKEPAMTSFSRSVQ
jgi:hypothetical protein